MKKLITFVLLCLFAISPVFAEINWQTNTNQKIQGLATVWSEVKFGFPYPEKLEELDWDSKFLEYLPRVMAAQDEDIYYKVLMELSTLLNDSHTAVMPPWEYFKPGYDMPPLEIRVIDDRFYVVNREETEDILANRIEIGTEVLEVEGIPVREYFNENVLKYHTQGSLHGSDAFYTVYLLYGPADEVVRLKLKDSQVLGHKVKGHQDIVREVSLKRNSWEGKGPLIYEFAYNSLVADKISYHYPKKNILYIKIPSFENAQIRDSFLELLQHADLDKVKGMIIDLRNNTGGSSLYSDFMTGCLINEPVSTPYRHIRHYSAAHKAWGIPQHRDHKYSMINPCVGKCYNGPIIVLINAITNSSAEDMAIELKSAGKTRIVGQPSNGGAGNTLTFDLPGGGYFRMATLKATYPDGTEYIGKGIKPDIQIAPSIDDIVEGRDPVLEKAVKMLK